MISQAVAFGLLQADKGALAVDLFTIIHVKTVWKTGACGFTYWLIYCRLKYL